MKNLSKFLGIALVVVIGLGVVSCSNDGGGGVSDNSNDDNGNNNNANNNVYFGNTLNLSGQVYLWNDDDSFTPFTDNRTVTDGGIGGSGSITNGILSYSIGTPSILKGIDILLEEFHGWDNVHASNMNVKFWWLELSTNKYNASVFVEEFVHYLYVDNNVNITGNPKTIPYGNRIRTYKDLSLALKKGWNAVHAKNEYGEGTETISVMMSNPAYLRWVLSE